MKVCSMSVLEEGSSFDSFEQFERALETYCKANYVVLCTSQSERVETANKHISESAKPYDVKFCYRSIRYKCKHGGDIRSKGKGIRSNQR